jgi:nucleotide-binding universal stress UspA family protein
MTSTLFASPPTPASATITATKPILVGTDFSPASQNALHKAIEMARKEGAELIVAHVYEPAADLSFSGPADDFFHAEAEQKLKAAAEKELEPVITEIRAAGINVRGITVAGHADHRLANLAVEIGAGVLVVGTHGRTGIRKLVTGSVASKLIAIAPCPVLTVK